MAGAWHRSAHRLAGMESAERELLVFAAAHRVVVAGQADVLLADKTVTHDVLDSLIGAGWLQRLRVMAGAADCYVITRAGLAAIDSALPAPVLELWDLRGALAAGWVHARARDGRFGDVEVLSEREMIAHDVALVADAGRARPYGVRVPGYRAKNASGLTHPDVLSVMHDGWAAVHVQLGSVAPRHLAALLTAYGSDERYGRLVFVVEQEQVAREIEAVAVSAGVAAMTLVQWFQWR